MIYKFQWHLLQAQLLETLEDDIGEAGAIELALELLKSTPGPASKVLCNLTLSSSYIVCLCDDLLALHHFDF